MNPKDQDITVFITGATGRFGKIIVEGFSKIGASIIFTGRKKSSAKSLIKQGLDQGAKSVNWISIDLEDKKTSQVVKRYLDKNRLLPTVLINCARNLKYSKANSKGIVERTSWQGEFLLNVIVPYELSMVLVNTKKSKLKKIINIGSIYGVNVPNLKLYNNPIKESFINYGVTKAAQIHLSEELAVRLASKGVEVNSISYGGLKGRVTKGFEKKYSQLNPSNKMLVEEDIFGPIYFLSVDNSRSITGHNLIVDGGWTKW